MSLACAHASSKSHWRFSPNTVRKEHACTCPSKMWWSSHLAEFNARLRPAEILPTTDYLLLATCYLLPDTYYLLPTTYYLLPTTYYLLPTTYDAAFRFLEQCVPTWELCVRQARISQKAAGCVSAYAASCGSTVTASSSDDELDAATGSTVTASSSDDELDAATTR